MDAIAKIRRKLERYPSARVECSPNSIKVLPTHAQGFEVMLAVSGEAFVVSFEGWHEHFDQEDGALACFGFGLSSRCRLVITYRGDKPVRWRVESNDEGTWRADSETGSLFVPFWRPKRIEYRTNALVESDPADGTA